MDTTNTLYSEAGKLTQHEAHEASKAYAKRALTAMGDADPQGYSGSQLLVLDGLEEVADTMCDVFGEVSERRFHIDAPVNGYDNAAWVYETIADAIELVLEAFAWYEACEGVDKVESACDCLDNWQATIDAAHEALQA